MAWFATENRLGLQPIAVNSTSQKHAEGTIITGQDDTTYGGGEFIYLKGVANTVVGSLVIYDTVNHTTTLAVNTAVQNRPVAVAMSASVASQWGWYQIAGVAVIKKTAVAFAAGPLKVYLSGTAGRIKGIASAGLQIGTATTVNAATVASATSTINVLINRPFLQPQIT